MRISDHIDQQEQAIWSDISAAVEAGESRGSLEHNFRLLETAVKGIEIAAPQTLDVLGAGYFSVFADAEGEWDYHLQRAGMSLMAVAPMMSGLDVTLKTVLEYFTDLKRRNIAAARCFGIALCRMHPTTVEMTA